MSGVGIMGIDPGLGGGIAILTDDSLILEPMPRDEAGALDLFELNKIISDHANDLRCAFVEKVHAMPKNGVTGMFNFGRNYGIILGMLVANRVKIIDVRPQDWMKTIHLEYNVKVPPKERNLVAFKKIFPNIDARRTVRCKGPDLGLVDAALIAEFGRRSFCEF